MSFFKKITQEFENLGFGDKKKEEGAPQQAQDSKFVQFVELHCFVG